MSAKECRPNFSGVWKLNLEKSVLRGPAPKRILVSIEHQEPALRQRVLITHADGREQRATFVLQTGAETINAIGGAAMRTRAWWEEMELVIESRMKRQDREAHFKDHWSLSADGQTLGMEHRDDDLAGQTSVLEKTSADTATFDD